MENKDSKSIALIVSPSEENREQIKAAIARVSPHTTIYCANDGSEALTKFHNVPAHVVITEKDLEKISGIRLVETLLAKEKGDAAFILLSAVPETEIFVNEILTGKVQFVPELEDDDKFIHALTKSFNFSANKHANEYRMKYLAAGEILVREGEKGQSVYILRSGKMHAFTQKGDLRTILGMIEPGEFVGEMAYIQGQARMATVEAVSECELIEIPMANLDHLLFTKPAWSKALMATLSKRLRLATETQKTGTD